MPYPKGKSAPLGFIYSHKKNLQVIKNGYQYCRAWGGFGKRKQDGSHEATDPTWAVELPQSRSGQCTVYTASHNGVHVYLGAGIIPWF